MGTKSIISVVLLLAASAFAGYPPTTSQDSSDSSPVPTFDYAFPNFTGTHTGTAFSLGVNSIAGGGTGQVTANDALNALLPSQASASGQFLMSDGTNSSWAAVSGSGTVTSVSVVSAHGLAGSVATATTTPAITLSTSVSGLVKGDGTSLSAATSGTDYSSGTSGLSTGILKSTTGTGVLSIATAPDFPTLNQNTSGNAATATALAANPTDCSANQYADAIDASGNLTCAQVAYSQITGTPSLSYLPLAGGTMSGDINMSGHNILAPLLIESVTGTTTFTPISLQVGGTLAMIAKNDLANLKPAVMSFVNPVGIDEITISIPTTSPATAPDLANFGLIGGTFGISFTSSGAEAIVAGNSSGSGTALIVFYTGSSTVASIQTLLNNWIAAHAPSLVLSGGNLTFIGTGSDTWDFTAVAYPFVVQTTATSLTVDTDINIESPYGEVNIDGVGAGPHSGVHIAGNSLTDTDPSVFSGVSISSNSSIALEAYTLVFGTLDLAGNNGINFADPINPQDAMTLNYAGSTYLAKSSNLSDLANRQTSLNNLAGAVTNRDFIRCDGSNCGVAAIQAADVPTLNQNTSGSAASLSATLVVGSGGLGVANPTAHDVLVGEGSSPVTPITPGTAGKVLTSNGTGSDPSFQSPATNGTVTSASVASANGFAGSVATATTTPAITLSTTVTGVVKGNGTALSVATSGTDYSNGTSALATGILKSTTSTGALTIAVAGDFPTFNQNTSGSAASLSATLAIGSGGTNATTAAAAFNNLAPLTTTGDMVYDSGTATAARLPIGSSTNLLTVSGGIPAWEAIPTWNQNTSGTAAGLSATLAIGSGGTNATTANAGFNNLSPMSTLGDIEYEDATPKAVRLAGNTTATKNFLVQTGTGSVSAAPAWGTIAAGDVPTLNQNTTGSAGSVTSVSMRYFSSTSTITSALATVTLATKDYDTATAYSAGSYTIPSTGKYLVNVGLLFGGTGALNNKVVVEIQKNSTVVSRYTTFYAGAQTDMKVAFSDLINCTASDTIRIQASSAATSPTIQASNFDNYLSISKEGN